MKRETAFRRNTVDPFLKKLPHSFWMSIQQLAIIGSPDKLGWIRGWGTAIEMKSEGKEPTPLQAYNLDEIAKVGGVALAVRPENWGQIQNLLWGLAHGYITPNHLPNWRTFL